MKRVLVPLHETQEAEAALPLIEDLCAAGDAIVLFAVTKPEARQAAAVKPGQRVRGGFAGPSGGVQGLVMPDVPVFYETEDQTFDRQVNEVLDRLEGFAAKLTACGFHASVEVRLDEHPERVILEYTRQMRPNYVVIIHSGAKDERNLLDQVASRVVEDGGIVVMKASRRGDDASTKSR